MGLPAVNFNAKKNILKFRFNVRKGQLLQDMWN